MNGETEIMILKINHMYFAGLALIAIFWGSNFGISRWAMGVFPPEVFVFLRFGFALPFLFVILKWTEGYVRLRRGTC
jgi:drug/metabolite transporter (DMT)-like permease